MNKILVSHYETYKFCECSFHATKLVRVESERVG